MKRIGNIIFKKTVKEEVSNTTNSKYININGFKHAFKKRCKQS